MVPPRPPHSAEHAGFDTYSPYSNFHLPSSSESSDGDDECELPFPAALLRKDFLTPDFEPAAYLSSLFPSEDGTTSAQRHQTLEDLRTELRERSSAISAELLELVNANYTSFLSLGDELRGGDEKVEDVRVALFGFRRSVEDIQNRVRERRIAVNSTSQELSKVRSSISIGRKLLELDDRISLLEKRLSISGTAGADANSKKPEGVTDLDDEIWGIEETDEEEESEELGGRSSFYVGSSPTKLTAIARDLILAKRTAQSLDHSIPLIKTAEERLVKCQDTLLLDLNSALKESRKAGSNHNGQSRLLKIFAVYRILDSEDEVVHVLKAAN